MTVVVLFGSTHKLCGFCRFLAIVPLSCLPGQFMHMYKFIFPFFFFLYDIALTWSSGHYSWLQYDRRVLDHEFPKKNSLPPSVHHHHLQQLQPNNNHGNKCALVLYFLIKYAQFSNSSMSKSTVPIYLTYTRRLN